MDICVNKNTNKLSAIFLLTLIALTGCGGGGGGGSSTATTNTSKTYYQDADDDGYGNLTVAQEATSQPAGYVLNSTDCDDTSILIHPAATENPSDGIDNNCNGQTDEVLTTYYQDLDDDTYGNPNNSQDAIALPAGYVADNTDCDDSEAAINPNAQEVIDDGIDNDCDGLQSVTYYQDADGDLYGDPAVTQVSTSQPTDFVLNNSDCDDTSATINPSATESQNDGIDNNCNGQIDEPPISIIPLNDTGITWGGNRRSGVNSTCIGDYISQQDCSQGRDTTHSDNTDGHAGFNYTKLGVDGNDLPASATNWSCIRDNVTGLIWEVKKDDDGLHDKDWNYFWYNSTGLNDGGTAGNGTTSLTFLCGDNIAAGCNTEEFVAKVNNVSLCGASNWRLPTVFELESLINYNALDPTVDSTYFPDVATNSFGIYTRYWSSTPVASQTNHVWAVNFFNASLAATGDVSSLVYIRTRLVRTAP